jgi:hypothetical protein
MKKPYRYIEIQELIGAPGNPRGLAWFGWEGSSIEFVNEKTTDYMEMRMNRCRENKPIGIYRLVDVTIIKTDEFVVAK